MTFWTSVLWKILMQVVKKWPDMAVKWPFISCYFLLVNQAGVMPPSTSEAITFYQSRFRPIKQLKTTVWTSVLWKILMQLLKKWPEIVIKWPFMTHKFSGFFLQNCKIKKLEAKTNVIYVIVFIQLRFKLFWHFKMTVRSMGISKSGGSQTISECASTILVLICCKLNILI